MITRDAGRFLALARACAPDFGPAFAAADELGDLGP